MIDHGNNGSYWNNPDLSKSFNQTIDTTAVPLSSFRCSEVLIINRTGGDLFISDNNNFDFVNELLLLDSESITLRGVSNCDSISARVPSSSGTIYYRASFYSNTPTR